MSKLLRIFSGIQPTGGSLHLGNYFGAVKRWVEATNNNDDKVENIFSVVDLHAMTNPNYDPTSLRTNTVSMTASLLACGLNPDRCILFQQSDVRQHSELAWILGCQCSVATLSKLSQYKEKSSGLKTVPLGLFLYPVLQAADILLYKATRVPVGEDNLQNVQVARDLQHAFNMKYKTKFFPTPEAILIKEDPLSRVKSLRNPEKKMSKSDADPKSCIFISDPPELVLEKCKKAVTDCTSKVTFEPERRPGVSNLVAIHAALVGRTPDEICDQVSDLDTGKYKLHLAEVINHHLRPIREQLTHYGRNEGEVAEILNEGRQKAESMAEITMKQVRKIVGLT